MKRILVLILALTLGGCSENVPTPEDAPGPCSTLATVRDFSGLDGCGFIFELSDGTRLEPVMIGYCGTPPLPKEVTDNPLYDFEWVNGKKVRISFEPTTNASICMAGIPVTITCITEVESEAQMEF